MQIGCDVLEVHNGRVTQIMYDLDVKEKMRGGRAERKEGELEVPHRTAPLLDQTPYS